MNEDKIGVPIYRMNEIHNMLCDLNVEKYAVISNDELNIFKLEDGDVLFNRTNSFEWVGRAGIYYKSSEDTQSHIFASYLVRFNTKLDKILPEYFVTFLSSKYGIAEIRRRARQSINQTNVNPEEVKEIEIPILSLNFQSTIKTLFKESYELLSKSKSLYSYASDLLLQELGLKDFNPSNENISIKTLKESFLKTGRLDSEYYQVKYEEILDRIKNYKYGYDDLANVCTVESADFIPDDDKTYKYIELSNITNSGLIFKHTENIGKLLPTRARRLVKKGDIIISSIEGSVEKTAIITEDYNNSLCSTGFYVVHSSIINSETLLVLFKSNLICNMIKQSCSGTILTSISEDAFKALPIPLVDIEIQSEIASYIKKSIAYSKVSKRNIKS